MSTQNLLNKPWASNEEKIICNNYIVCDLSHVPNSNGPEDVTSAFELIDHIVQLHNGNLRWRYQSHDKTNYSE